IKIKATVRYLYKPIGVYLKIYSYMCVYLKIIFICVCLFIYIVVYPWLRGLGYTSLGVFLLGFLLWNIDNIFCDSLRNFRKKLPPVIGVTTQFHAWWHILTGLGSYLHILFRVSNTNTTVLQYHILWPLLSFPNLLAY
ncbi:hypothetical protein FD755_017290, partial [Muntiacus reevesi]